MQDILSSGAGDGFNPIIIMVNIGLSFGLSYFIAVLYKATHKGLSYSQSFTQTLVVFSIVATAAMMVIGNSLARAFGLAGALSIIRFRTVIKEPKDIAYLFWVLVIGLACGTQGYPVAITATILVSIVVLLLDKTNFGSIRKHDYILRYYIDNEITNNEDVQELLQTYFKSCILMVINSHEGGRVLEFSYNVQFIKESEQSNLLKDLSSLKGVSNIHLLKATSDIEY
jgi:hypothetical protein